MIEVRIEATSGKVYGWERAQEHSWVLEMLS